MTDTVTITLPMGTARFVLEELQARADDINYEGDIEERASVATRIYHALTETIQALENAGVEAWPMGTHASLPTGWKNPHEDDEFVSDDGYRFRFDAGMWTDGDLQFEYDAEGWPLEDQTRERLDGVFVRRES